MNDSRSDTKATKALHYQCLQYIHIYVYIYIYICLYIGDIHGIVIGIHNIGIHWSPRERPLPRGACAGSFALCIYIYIYIYTHIGDLVACIAMCFNTLLVTYAL